MQASPPVGVKSNTPNGFCGGSASGSSALVTILAVVR